MKSMRKFVSLILSISIVVAILISTSLNVYAVDSEHHCCTDYGTSAVQVSTLYQTDNFATYYFYNLNWNLGENIHGSCVYVAFGMLLSFYDTYWSDDFVYDNFPYGYVMESVVESTPTLYVESPGALPDCFSEYSEDYTGYISQVYDSSNSFLHFELIKLGLGNGYVTGDGNLATNTDDFSNFWNLYKATLEQEAQARLANVSLIEIQGMNQNALNAAVIEKIDAGIPVFISAVNNVGSQHAMVAYDYNIDSTTGETEIFVHTGWRSQSTVTHAELSQMGYRIVNAYYLNLGSTSHRCAYNYITPNRTQSFCSCSFVATHPAHSHNLIYQYATPKKHNISCLCGYLDSTSHVVAGGSFGFTKCLLCNGIVNLGNDLGQLDGIGAENEINSTQDNVTIVEYITANGSYIRSDGIIVLAEEDVKPYLSGELIISE